MASGPVLLLLARGRSTKPRGCLDRCPAQAFLFSRNVHATSKCKKVISSTGYAFAIVVAHRTSLTAESRQPCHSAPASKPPRCRDRKPRYIQPSSQYVRTRREALASDSACRES